MRPANTGLPLRLFARLSARDQRLATTVGAAGIARAITMVTPLVTIPLIFNYLGAERYGLWMTVTSIVGMFTFADLGLGNGLLTKLGASHGGHDVVTARKYVSSAYFVVSGMALLLALLALFLAPITPWADLLNIASAEVRAEALSVTFVVFGAFLVNLPFGLIQRVQLGVQHGFSSYLWQSAGSVVSMLLVLLAVALQSSMAVLVACAVGVAPIVAILNAEWFYRRRHPEYRPRLRWITWDSSRELVGLGVSFCALSVLMALALHSDNLIVAHTLGLDQVAAFAVPVRLVAVLSSVSTLLCLPIWAANGEALARGDLVWVRRNTARMLALVVALVGSGAILLTLLGRRFLHWWIPGSLEVSAGLFGCLGVWAVLLAASSPFLMVLNGAGIVRFQVLSWLGFLPLSLLLKIALAKTVGLPGIPLGNAVAYSLVVVPQVWRQYVLLMDSHSAGRQV